MFWPFIPLKLIWSGISNQNCYCYIEVKKQYITQSNWKKVVQFPYLVEKLSLIIANTWSLKVLFGNIHNCVNNVKMSKNALQIGRIECKHANNDQSRSFRIHALEGYWGGFTPPPLKKFRKNALWKFFLDIFSNMLFFD